MERVIGVRAGALRSTTSKPVVYEGVGHTPHWEEPARFADDISAFALGAAQPKR